jgi:hypothetical protein
METARDRWAKKEKILSGMSSYVDGKDYKQARSRGFLAGIKFYEEEILNKKL